MTGGRLDVVGRSIDRSRAIDFSFEGKPYKGFVGDTLGSALLANGVDIVGRSFKYHRPRGIMAAGLDEPSAIMQIEKGAHTIPNLKAPAVELYDGLAAKPVNAWPSVSFDVMAVNALFSSFLPAGFYYKTFMWPDWRWFEPAIRRAAGLGVSPVEPDPDVYDKRYAQCDVLVVGGGPAGLAAAQAASRSGARVMIVEHDREWGGSLLSREAAINGEDGSVWANSVVEELTAAKQTTMLNRTMAFGYYDHNLIGLVQRLTDHLPLRDRDGPRQRLWKVRAGRVILATGALERPLVFPNNDRPGVMLAGAAQAYVRRYATAPGQRVVVAANNDSAYDAAFFLHRAGIDIAAILDARPGAAGRLAEKARAAGIAVMPQTTVTNVNGARGVRQAEAHQIDVAGRAVPGTRSEWDCDAVIMSGGWSPVVHLHSQSGGKLRYDETAQAFAPGKAVQSSVSVGAAGGVYSLKNILFGAQRAGIEAAETAGFNAEASPLPEVEDGFMTAVAPLWRVDVSALSGKRAKAWVDFQNDVTAGDVSLAIRESFKSVEHVKRYTTLGMATDQGKTSNINAIGIMSEELGAPLPQVGVTTFRPPYDPVTIGVFAGQRLGDRLTPMRSLAAKEAHASAGAVFDDYGGWSRAAYYTPEGESEAAAIVREVQAVRERAGLFEASPLGKIEVCGPDAGVFLNRFYANNMLTLKPGHCRYGLMLNENGMIIDDGVLACLEEGHYLVGTTSGHASLIAESMNEWLQCEWPDLRVVTQDVTTAWAVANIAGPRAREVMSQFDWSFDISREAFGHMQVRCGFVEGVPCRVQRVSFSGELSYEIAAPWNYGASIWSALMAAGASYGIAPFGIEALMTLRVEKGFLHIGSDTDGMTIPQDVGFAKAVQNKKHDFIGRRSIMRPDAERADRRQFVGLETVGDDGTPLPIGGHILSLGAIAPTRTQGWVTSSVDSPTIGRGVALALVERGRERIGEEVQVWSFGASRRAKIAAPCVYDRDGERLHA